MISKCEDSQNTTACAAASLCECHPCEESMSRSVYPRAWERLDPPGGICRPRLQKTSPLHDRFDALFILCGQPLHRLVHPVRGDDTQKLKPGLKA